MTNNRVSETRRVRMIKNHNKLKIVNNSYVDDGDGTIVFPNGLVITDGSIQRNNTSYDIESMDINEYKGQLTADHRDELSHIIGQVDGVHKSGNRVLINKIKYLVKENPYARLAYNIMLARNTSDFSIETYGPAPDNNGVYKDSVLVGLSQVVVGNNRNASLNSLVCNSLKQSIKDGVDTNDFENQFEDILSKQSKDNGKENMFVTIKNSRDFAITVKYKNAAEDEVETTLEPNATIDVSEEQKETVENQLQSAEAPKEEVKTENDLGELIKNAISPLTEKIEAIEKEQFNKGAQKPEFKEATRKSTNKFDGMDWRERHAAQINSVWDWQRTGSPEAATTLNKLNEFNLSDLKKEGIVTNSMTLSDFGNFVISPELLTEIQGCRNDYTALINATEWKETLSTQFAWLRRSGDINMQSVEFCDDGANGNRKPISEYSASIETSDLEELAAVTPVCNAATRFLAADLLGDVAKGYSNDYDRKRAQLVIARLEQALEANGNSIVYGDTDTVATLTDWVDAWAEIATCTPNGTFVFNTSTYAEIMRRAVQHGTNGPLSSIFITGEVPTIFGRPFIVTPDDLMPTLNTAQTKVIPVNGSNVTVNHAVFYANLNNFTGRTSGGLQYDLSNDAAYEDGGTVKSAYQRNELVLRGSFFRGGAIKDENQVSGILSPGVS